MTKSGRVAFSKMDEVAFGQPAAEAVGDVVTRLGAQRAGVFDSMPPHTPRSAVITATDMARNASADLIVTLGGGSITDGAKAVQLCLANNIRDADAIDGLRTVIGSDGVPVPPAINPPTVRQISIPTTLSGGEFSGISGVTDERTKVKELIRHADIIPQAVVLDPAVTVHTPEWLWLSTGIRAVDHCVEGICSLEAHSYGDAQALQGLSRLASGLPRVKADPSDIQARLDCQMGTWLSMGPLASGVPMGASHGIGYVLGAVFDIPHGHTSCIMLPAVMRWNKSANEDRQKLISIAMGRPGDDAAVVLDEFIAGLDMPRSLSAVSVGADHFDRIAEQSMGTPWIPRNPRPIPTPAQVREILEIAA